MRVHHLNCATMTPLIVGRIVCHVLLCESTDGLVLVDSGFGSADCADHSRIGPARWLLNARFSEAETAARQLEALGYARSDVRHIVVTHFDLDHVGGLSDFPHATAHTTAVEFDTANQPPTRVERHRYRSVQWSHAPKVRTYTGSGEPWQGFSTAYPVDGVPRRVDRADERAHARACTCRCGRRRSRLAVARRRRGIRSRFDRDRS